MQYVANTLHPHAFGVTRASSLSTSAVNACIRERVRITSSNTLLSGRCPEIYAALVKGDPKAVSAYLKPQMVRFAPMEVQSASRMRVAETFEMKKVSSACG